MCENNDLVVTVGWPSGSTTRIVSESYWRIILICYMQAQENNSIDSIIMSRTQVLHKTILIFHFSVTLFLTVIQNF